MSQPRGRAVPPAPGGNQPGKEAGAGARAARWGLRSLAGPGTSRAGRGHGGSPSGPRAWRGRRSARGRAAGGRQQVRGRRAAARGPAPGPPLTLALALALALAGGTHKMADAAFGAGTQHRRVASGAVFILPSTRPVVARAPSALEADGNFCGLNTGLRRAGLFGLAALPPRPVPHPFMPRPGPPPLLQAWGLCPPSLAAVALRGLCRPRAGLPGPPPQVRKRLRVLGLPARACASQTGGPSDLQILIYGTGASAQARKAAFGGACVSGAALGKAQELTTSQERLRLAGPGPLGRGWRMCWLAGKHSGGQRARHELPGGTVFQAEGTAGGNALWCGCALLV